MEPSYEIEDALMSECEHEHRWWDIIESRTSGGWLVREWQQVCCDCGAHVLPIGFGATNTTYELIA